MKPKLKLVTGIFALLLMASCTSDDLIDNQIINQKVQPELITLKSGVVVEKRGSNYIWEGDILLTPEQLSSLDKTGSLCSDVPEVPGPDLTLNPVTNMPITKKANSRNLGLYPTSYNLWAMLRFTYNSALTDTQKERIKTALLHIEAKTNVRFYNATGQPTRDPDYGFDYPYIDFVPIGDEDTSESYVGRIGGRQQVSLAEFAFKSYNTGVIEHEICHALGMLHEQCRPDRDNYVTINSSNLTSKGAANFSKRTTNYYCIGSYDFNSVMGYGSYTSSKSMVNNTSQPMYTKKDGSTIYQGSCLSDQDRIWLNNLYLPYTARSDVYRELADVVYKPDNTIMTPAERLQLQADLNNGNPNPPAGGRIPNNF